jgi:hypothetical protein
MVSPPLTDGCMDGAFLILPKRCATLEAGGWRLEAGAEELSSSARSGHLCRFHLAH